MRGQKITVLINGCCGKMGKEVVHAVLNDKSLQLTGAVDITNIGRDCGEVAGTEKTYILIKDNLIKTIKNNKPQVVVDFTNPQVVMSNLKTILNAGTSCVVGTTGINDKDLNLLNKLALKNKAGIIVCPNFSLGANILMKISQFAAKFLNNFEVIELHHDKKLDAPSGTAIKTVQMIMDNNAKCKIQNAKFKSKEVEKIPGVRGGELNGVRIHSVRLPGLVAHQEVIFGGTGETLSLRHDSISRESFMPGVLMCIKKVVQTKGLIYGLEKIIFK